MTLSSCQTVVKTPAYTIPPLTAVRPPLVPDGLIDEPQDTADVLHNSIVYEFALYDWQDYALELEDYQQVVDGILQGN